MRPAYALVAAGMFTIGAMGHLPDGAYRPVHLLVVLGSSYGAFRFYDSDKFFLGIGSCVAAIIVNPAIPLHLPRAVWGPLDLCIGIGLLLLAAIDKYVFRKSSA